MKEENGQEWRLVLRGNGIGKGRPPVENVKEIELQGKTPKESVSHRFLEKRNAIYSFTEGNDSGIGHGNRRTVLIFYVTPKLINR